MTSAESKSIALRAIRRMPRVAMQCLFQKHASVGLSFPGAACSMHDADCLVAVVEYTYRKHLEEMGFDPKLMKIRWDPRQGVEQCFNGIAFHEL